MEGEIRMAETEQGHTVSNEAESSIQISNNSPTKRGRGRSQGSKKLKVCVTDVNLMELVSGISNGGSTQSQSGRVCPELSGTQQTTHKRSDDNHADNSVQTHQGEGRPKESEKQANNGDSPLTDHTPKKRGRPKKSLSKSTAEKGVAGDLPNGGSDTPKIGRGRPKGSIKRKSESLTSGDEDEGSSVKLKKRGRPKGALNKKPRLEKEVNSEGEAETDGSLNTSKREEEEVEVDGSEELTQEASNGISNTPRRGRGRPRKSVKQKRRNQRELVTETELVTEGSQPEVKRGRGRPKGSLNKKPPAYKVHGNMGRTWKVQVPSTLGKRGRSRKQPGKRGRPRKYPLPSPEELKKPKVWKPLGRPRKYPRVDPPEGVSPAPRRSRGRPRKSESKKGAHFRKNLPSTPNSTRNPTDGPQRKRGRPPSTKKTEDATPRKRGRPKGSVNKNTTVSKTQLDSTLPDHSNKKRGSSVGLECEGEPAAKQSEHDAQTIPTKDGNHTQAAAVKQHASLEVSNQA